MPVNLTTPVGRLVGGSVSELQVKKDPATNQTKKDSAGNDMKNCWFHVAIPKNPGEQHWNQTAWGQQIWAEGHRAHPSYAPHPSFAWKVEDGDSIAPNKKGVRNCDREGHPGHWIVKFTSGFVPKTYNRDGSAPVPPESIKTGYYVQVNFDVRGNTGASPGVYLNPAMVALSAYGEEIQFAPDVAEAGFGQAALPAGAMATPPAGFVAPVAPTAPSATTVNPPPNPAILNLPPVPGMPPVQPPAPQRVMLPAANGATYEQMIAAGWTDALLIQHGMMQG